MRNPDEQHHSNSAMPTEFSSYLSARRSNGESLATIAASLGVSQPLVSQWIAGQRTPSRTVLILAAILARSSAGRWPL